MRVTRERMEALNKALTAIYDLNIGEENLGFWLENQGERYAGPDVAEARGQVTNALPMLRAACQQVIAVIDGKPVPLEA